MDQEEAVEKASSPAEAHIREVSNMMDTVEEELKYLEMKLVPVTRPAESEVERDDRIKLKDSTDVPLLDAFNIFHARLSAVADRLNSSRNRLVI